MNTLTTLTINDLHHADQLDASAMARVIGGEKTQATLPKEKPVKLTYVNGDIIGTWANGTTMAIPML
jgi:hypothetical protein